MKLTFYGKLLASNPFRDYLMEKHKKDAMLHHLLTIDQSN